MVLSADRYLGVGIYPPREAAMYLHVQSRAVRRWVYGDGDGDPVIDATLGTGDFEAAITFTDLIQCRAVRAIRQQFPKISLPKIRQAVFTAIKETGLRAPLARDHEIRVFGNELVGVFPKRTVGITGTVRHQEMMHTIVAPFLEEIDFGEDGLAARWTPEKQGDYSIVLDPQHRLGQPVVMPDGILVSAVVDSVTAEGSIEAAAEMHRIDSDAVRLAWKYWDRLRPAMAA